MSESFPEFYNEFLPVEISLARLNTSFCGNLQTKTLQRAWDNENVTGD